MTKARKEGILQSLSTKGIRSKRCRTSPVKNNDVIVPPGSDDEDAKVDLLCRRKLFLKKSTESGECQAHKLAHATRLFA